MTCGIYMLSWFDTHKVYVGQSEVAVESRHTDHIRKLQNGTHTIKMNTAYTEFGLPDFEILEVCLPEELDDLENYHIKLWDAVDDGFNTFKTAGMYIGGTLPGEKNSNSKYSNEQIIKVFNFLLDNPTLTHKEMGELLDVQHSTISMIANGSRHTWLARVCPIKYAEMLANIGKNKKYNNSYSKDRVVYKVISPRVKQYLWIISELLVENIIYTKDILVICLKAIQKVIKAGL